MRMAPERAMAAAAYVVLNWWGRRAFIVAWRHIATNRKSQYAYCIYISMRYNSMITGLIIPLVIHQPLPWLGGTRPEAGAGRYEK